MGKEPHSVRTKQQVVEAFHQLLEERKGLPSRMVTKEEAAEKEKDQRIIEAASTYTVERVVKDLADLQLHFGEDIEELAERLGGEVRKLEEIRRAIEVEAEHLQELRHIKLAEEALDILEQEHQSELRAFEEEVERQRSALDRDMAEKRKEWQSEQEEHERSVRAYEESLQKERGQEEENYRYEVERKRKLETDAYEERKRTLEREWAEAAAEKEKEWAERESLLAERQPLLEEYKAKAQAFPQELEEAVEKAREEAIKAAQQAAKVNADLFEKEVEANRKVYEATLQALEKTMDEQNEHIEALTADLRSALKQVQALASKALEGSSSMGNIPFESPKRGDAA